MPGARGGWRLAIPGGRALATPAVVGGVVYVGGGFGSHELYALDEATGVPVWAIAVSDDGPTAALVARGRVVFNTESCTLFVVDARTGEHVWSRWLGDPLMSQPASDGEHVFIAYPHADGRHRLIALALEDGRFRWEVPISGDVISAPVVAEGSIFLATFDGAVERHRLADGALSWRHEIRATSAPWIVDGEVFVAQRGAAPTNARRREGFTRISGLGAIQSEMAGAREADYLDPKVQARSSYTSATRASDAAVGFAGGPPPSSKAAAASANVGQGTVRGLWEYQGSRPAVRCGVLYATHGSVLRALDARTAEPRWERPLPGDPAQLGGHLGSPPAFSDRALVVGTTTGEVTCFDAQSGGEVLRCSVPGPVRFQPALAGGRIHVGTAGGTLVCIDTGDPTLDGWTMWGGGPGHNGREPA